ncbi:cytochrome P450 2Y3 [Stigmatopora argus]
MELCGSTLLLGFLLLLLWSLFVKKRAGLPPGPLGFPLLGNLPQVDKHVPFKSLLQLSKKYGPVMTLHLGWQRTVVLVGYETVKEALVDQGDDFTGRMQLPFLVKATRGYGIGLSNGERWRQLRRFTLTTLRDFGMGRKGMEAWIQEESKHLLARLHAQNGAPLDPSFLLSCSVSNVICCLVFGRRYDYEDADFLDLLAIISQMIQLMASPLGQMYNIFPWLTERLPGRHHKVFAQIEVVRAFIQDKIQQHRNSFDPEVPRDYIDCFLKRIQEEKHLESTEFFNENLEATVMNLFIAGTETSSSTIRYALSVFIKHPEVQEKMQQEIDAVIGRERSVNMEDRKSMPYTDAVIHEVQRFLDIVPFSLPHYTLRDITFRGYAIPKDTIIIPLLHSVLKDETQWANPGSFDPQHFLDHNGNFKKNAAFVPFSAGKRACVGESLARMELFVFLVSLLQHFSFSSPGGPDSVDLTPEYSSFANMPRRHLLVATPRQ